MAAYLCVFGTRRRVVACRVEQFGAAADRVDRVKAANRGKRGLVVGVYQLVHERAALVDMRRRMPGVRVVFGR